MGRQRTDLAPGPASSQAASCPWGPLQRLRASGQDCKENPGLSLNAVIPSYVYKQIKIGKQEYYFYKFFSSSCRKKNVSNRLKYFSIITRQHARKPKTFSSFSRYSDSSAFLLLGLTYRLPFLFISSLRKAAQTPLKPRHTPLSKLSASPERFSLNVAKAGNQILQE